ncbi:putative indole-3-pyruvate monooxygenase YUCCA10 [Apostasia shenzhenica]|uniref:indole-3-pyruvate monooxygenase n=1 Tax=Apostasia shenzhenica TaxID=1088818 RepID=A0A2I0A632_9ASPA|nr:putative indole-3-pyruvate monooxygenase YUCCA10 [Apostasia shenzhenica]
MSQTHSSFSTTAVVVGAGPAGLAAGACLSSLSVPFLILERDNSPAPLWRHRTYHRLHLHLPKQFCQLPLLPIPSSAPTFVSVADFLRYLDSYAAAFRLGPHLRLRRRVDSAEFDATAGRWSISSFNLETGEVEEYGSRFLVVATGENDKPVVPHDVPGLDRFSGEAIHSNRFRSGKSYEGLAVLVVGSGNSGMEIACDLAENGSRPAIVVRSAMHLVTKEIWAFGILLKKYLPIGMVDSIVLMLCYIWLGSTSKYGLHRPSKGPFYLKDHSPAYPVIDAGTYKRIKSGDIEVLPAISSVEGEDVKFVNGKERRYDAIILATGYRSAIKNWLKGDDYLIGDDGMAMQEYPKHWKGKNGLYCCGLARRGLYGAAEDALSIANDISNLLLNDRSA